MSVYAAKTNSLSSLALEKIYKVFVDLTGKNHLNNIDSLLIGYSESVNKFGLFAEFVRSSKVRVRSFKYA